MRPSSNKGFKPLVIVVVPQKAVLAIPRGSASDADGKVRPDIRRQIFVLPLPLPTALPNQWCLGMEILPPSLVKREMEGDFPH